MAASSPETAPLVVWLQGGPGWPSTYGFFKEVKTPTILENSCQIGAFGVWLEEGQVPRLVARGKGWGSQANLLFIDRWGMGGMSAMALQPRGSGLELHRGGGGVLHIAPGGRDGPK